MDVSESGNEKQQQLATSLSNRSVTLWTQTLLLRELKKEINGLTCPCSLLEPGLNQALFEKIIIIMSLSRSTSH